MYVERVKHYRNMIQKFIESYIKAFGTAAPLPVAFGYSDKACSGIGKNAALHGRSDSQSL